MKTVFIKKALPKNLQSRYSDYQNDCRYILEKLQDTYEYEKIEDINVLLFYSYFKLECAMSIHVDDVLPTAEAVIKRFENVERTTNVLSFLAFVEKIRIKAKKEQKRVESLVKRNFDSLTLSEKKDVAYKLADLKDVLECQSLATKYFLQLYKETGNVHYFGVYVSCLYDSGMKEDAVAQFEHVLESSAKWIFQQDIYQKLLDYHSDNKEAFRHTWDRAICICDKFPVTLSRYLPILQAAYKFGFKDICMHMVTLMREDKIAVPIEIQLADSSEL